MELLPNTTPRFIACCCPQRVRSEIFRDGSLTVQPEQAEVVRTVYRQFLTEGKGAHTIARELTERGVRPPLRAEGAWSSAMILKILRNEKYCGDLLQKKYRTVDYLSHRKIVNDGAEEQILLRDHHEPVVSRAQFEAAQAELARRRAEAEDRRKFSARHWYSGKVRCGACGRSFALKRARRTGGTEYQRFVCRGRLDGDCRMRTVHGAVIRAAAQRVLGELALDRGAILSSVLDELRALGQSQSSDGSAAKLRQAIARQRARRDRALEAFLDGALSQAELRRTTARCDEELQRLEKQLAASEQAEPGADRAAQLRTWLAVELSGGDAVLDEVIRRITVYPDFLEIEISELPVRFRVRAEGRGAGADYRVEVTECVPDGPDSPGV